MGEVIKLNYKYMLVCPQKAKPHYILSLLVFSTSQV